MRISLEIQRVPGAGKAGFSRFGSSVDIPRSLPCIMTKSRRNDKPAGIRSRFALDREFGVNKNGEERRIASKREIWTNE